MEKERLPLMSIVNALFWIAAFTRIRAVCAVAAVLWVIAVAGMLLKKPQERRKTLTHAVIGIAAAAAIMMRMHLVS